eukprot:1159116-Pelagomonas_calceolata.AAC.1
MTDLITSHDLIKHHTGCQVCHKGSSAKDTRLANLTACHSMTFPPPNGRGHAWSVACAEVYRTSPAQCAGPKIQTMGFAATMLRRKRVLSAENAQLAGLIQ